VRDFDVVAAVVDAVQDLLVASPRLMSTGFTMTNRALNSTRPFALRGALSRLTMPALSGSRGSASMYTVPSSRSKEPTLPKPFPSANRRVCSTTKPTTRASLESGAAANRTRAITTSTGAFLITLSPPAFLLGAIISARLALALKPARLKVTRFEQIARSLAQAPLVGGGPARRR